MKTTPFRLLTIQFILMFSIVSVCLAQKTAETGNPSAPGTANTTKGCFFDQTKTPAACCPLQKECQKEAGPFSGFWKTNIVDLCLVQKGRKVTGAYRYKGGRIDGTVTDGRLDYTWIQEDGKTGKGYFVLSADGQSITGAYGYGDSNSDGQKWTGQKSVCPAATLSSPEKK